MLANQARTELAAVEFKQRLEAAIIHVTAFRDYAETTRRERPDAGDRSTAQAQPFYFSIPVNPIDVSKCL